MDNTQMPLVQPTDSYQQGPVSGGYGSVGAPIHSVGTGGPLPQGRADVGGLVKTIAIVILSLMVLTFVGLFIWSLTQYNDLNENYDKKVASEVAKAKDEQAMELETEFAEREKDPYRWFSGPADYGELSFEYPKTWSVYIDSDASDGDDYEAYLNPIEVNKIGRNTINALRVKVRDKDFESVVAEYQRYLDRRDTDLTVETTTVAGTMANRYTGTIPDSELSGIIVIFKIRDKTAVLQTDSILFQADFDRLLSTVKFNA
jgi:hypothetical protein